MGSHLLAIDQGTTSSRALLFNDRAEMVASHQEEFPQIFPQQGWVEHDPMAIWQSVKTCLDEVLKTEEVAAIGITNQRETTIIWDKATGQPIHNAIVWQDRRTAQAIDALKAKGLEAEATQRSGLVLDAYFSASKIAWILDHVEGARARADAGELAFGTVDSWLIWQLTGGRLHVTDATNASRTLLYNIHDNDWDDWLLELFNVPKALLPKIVDSCAIIGHTDASVTGKDIPIAGIAGDQQAATFGHLCTEPGYAKNTYGTGCFLVSPTGDTPAASSHKLLSTVAWQRNGQVSYALEGSIFTAGAAINWAAEQMGIGKSGRDITRTASEAEDNGGVYFVPALAGLGAPHWNQYAQGTWLGITRATTRAHLARAVLEGIAFQVHDMVRAMEQDIGAPLKELMVDGGVSRSDVLLQFQADILGIPILRPRMVESTAQGVAFLAGLAVGIWPDMEALRALPKEHDRFEPSMDNAECERLLTRWNKALAAAELWSEAA